MNTQLTIEIGPALDNILFGAVVLILILGFFRIGERIILALIARTPPEKEKQHE